MKELKAFIQETGNPLDVLKKLNEEITNIIGTDTSKNRKLTRSRYLEAVETFKKRTLLNFIPATEEDSNNLMKEHVGFIQSLINNLNSLQGVEEFKRLTENMEEKPLPEQQRILIQLKTNIQHLMNSQAAPNHNIAYQLKLLENSVKDFEFSFKQHQNRFVKQDTAPKTNHVAMLSKAITINPDAKITVSSQDHIRATEKLSTQMAQHTRSIVCQPDYLEKIVADYRHQVTQAHKDSAFIRCRYAKLTQAPHSSGCYSLEICLDKQEKKQNKKEQLIATLFINPQTKTISIQQEPVIQKQSPLTDRGLFKEPRDSANDSLYFNNGMESKHGISKRKT